MNNTLIPSGLRLGLLACALAGTTSAWSGTVFLDRPTNNSTVVSWHNTGGPVLADDFVPASSGLVNKVEWWGSAANSSSWELALHSNAGTNQPNIDDPLSGSSYKYFVTAIGVQEVGDPTGIFHFTANLTGSLLSIIAGTEYWFTAANAANGWTWADALGGPSVGSENFNAHRSIGGAGLCGDGGPHCGPWVDVHTDLAFGVSVVPEPASLPLALSALGMLGLVAMRRRGPPPAA